MVRGVQVERTTVRTTWTPWAASARLCLGRRWTGWEPTTLTPMCPRPGTAPPPNVNDEASAKMALGDIAPEAVGVASTIPAEVPGLAVAGDSSGGWIRIRTPYLSLADAAATCRETAELVPDVPALDPFRPHVLPPPVTVPVTLAKPRPANG